MVCFRAGDGHFAVPVESTIGVRTSEGIASLPGSHRDVVGVMVGQPPLTVLSTLGEGRDHVLVLSVDGVHFGLLVHNVLGVLCVREEDVGPPPEGQRKDYVTGSLTIADNLVLVADPRTLRGRL